jgi:hypothetical protein
LIVNLSYGNYNLHKIVNYQYDTVTHAVVSGSLGADLPVGGLGPGANTGYAQTVGTDVYTVKVQDSSPYAFVVHTSTIIPCNLSINTVAITPAMNGLNGEIQVTGQSGTGTYRYAITGRPKQVGATFLDVPPGNYVLTLSRTEDSCTDSINVTVPLIPDLQINLTGTNCSANLVDDGSVQLDILTGSGDFSANFVTEGVLVAMSGVPASTTRVSLAPNNYEVTVTDNITGQVVTSFVTIAYPVVVPPAVIGSVFKIPFINGLTFVVENTDAQQLDNKLFKDQRFGRYKQVEFLNPRISTDVEKVQFYSNFETHTLEIIDYCTDETIKVFDITKVQDNLASTIDLGLILKYHAPGLARVYFAVGSLPIPVQAGDVFTISNSLDGFDGTYSVLEVDLDIDLGLNYLVITLIYGAPNPQSFATGSFANALTNYNVYESLIGYAGIPLGSYYFRLSAFASNAAVANSEPIEIRSSDADTLAIVYSSFDNGDDVTWQTGYRGFIRTTGFIFKRFPGGVRTISRNANYSPVKVSSKSQRFVQLDTFTIPPYLHEKLAVIFDQDFFSVNGLPYQMTDGYPAPKYVDMYPLSDAEIKLEQLNWFPNYNGSDTATNNNSDMSCTCDTIDLLNVSSAPGVITLNLNLKKSRIFNIVPDIGAPKTWALSNDFIALAFKFVFTMSSLDAQTFPANFKMSDGRWDDVAKTWTPADLGKYLAEATFDGVNWNVEISQSSYI